MACNQKQCKRNLSFISSQEEWNLLYSSEFKPKPTFCVQFSLLYVRLTLVRKGKRFDLGLVILTADLKS